MVLTTGQHVGTALEKGIESKRVIFSYINPETVTRHPLSIIGERRQDLIQAGDRLGIKR